VKVLNSFILLRYNADFHQDNAVCAAAELTRGMALTRCHFFTNRLHVRNCKVKCLYSSGWCPSSYLSSCIFRRS